MILGFNKKNLCVSAEGVRPFCNDQLAGLCENLRKCNKKGIFIGNMEREILLGTELAHKKELYHVLLKSTSKTQPLRSDEGLAGGLPYTPHSCQHSHCQALLLEPAFPTFNF